MAKTRSAAINRYRYMIALFVVRAANATELTRLPPPEDGKTLFPLDTGIARVCIVLAVMVGFLLLWQWLIRRGRGGTIAKLPSGRAIQIVDRKALGPRQWLILVRVGRQAVLLHQGKGSLTPLCEFEYEQEEASK